MIITIDWDENEMMPLAMSGCEQFAVNGYNHLDLKRPHIGKAFIEGKMRVVFID